IGGCPMATTPLFSHSLFTLPFSHATDFTELAALSICIAGGSIVVSHVNDAGFWLFGKFTGATEAQTLKTW
ncbi:hypothetical protein JVW21_21365, partial [Vibrio cholerae O1]|nr:hypothetical protein [Vibrio cholerae O1]